MRNRTVQLNIRLTEMENNLLKRNSHRAGLTTSAYIRMLISDYIPKETPPISYHELMKDLYELNAKLPQSFFGTGGDATVYSAVTGRRHTARARQS